MSPDGLFGFFFRVFELDACIMHRLCWRLVVHRDHDDPNSGAVVRVLMHLTHPHITLHHA
jgi:hypothetical protein